MNAMSPENAVFLLHEVYIPTLQRESQITKGVLAAVPADKSSYRPDSVSKSANDLLRHIAASDVRFLDAVNNGQFSAAAVIPDAAKSPEEVVAWYEKRHAESVQQLLKLSGEQLTKPVDFRGMFQLPAVMFLAMGLHHTIHHRGQLSAYLRSMGAKVPSIYGESYDSEQARKSARA
ncbi:MAG TPA: DinB family protein [Candidatus Acidoferrum sp.]|nr:DinB family protein [Candidatus Acidoferrum sp.]